MKTSNKNARELVEKRETFKGSNTFSSIHTRTKGNIYAVYSYGYHFPMYIFKAGKWYANSDKYSVSTSKHQTQLRPHINLETNRLIGCTCPHECTHEKINYLNTSEMKNLINQ